MCEKQVSYDREFWSRLFLQFYLFFMHSSHCCSITQLTIRLPLLDTWLVVLAKQLEQWTFRVQLAEEIAKKYFVFVVGRVFFAKQFNTAMQLIVCIIPIKSAKIYDTALLVHICGSFHKRC